MRKPGSVEQVLGARALAADLGNAWRSDPVLLAPTTVARRVVGRFESRAARIATVLGHTGIPCADATRRSILDKKFTSDEVPLAQLLEQARTGSLQTTTASGAFWRPSRCRIPLVPS